MNLMVTDRASETSLRRSELGPLLYRRAGLPGFVAGPAEGTSASRTICGAIAGGVASQVVFGAGVNGLLLPLVGAFVGALSANAFAHKVRVRRMRQVPAVANPSDAGLPSPARVVGTVELDATVPPGPMTADEPDAVVVRSVFFQARPSGRPSFTLNEDMRGVPFRLRLQSGDVVQVEPAALFLIDPLRRRSLSPEQCRNLGASTRGLLRRRVLQTELRVGDAVELVGRLETQVDPNGRASPGRGTPTLTSVHAAWPEGVWIRRTLIGAAW